MPKQQIKQSLKITDKNSEPMPEPKTAKAGTGKAIIWAMIAICIVGAIFFWMRKTQAERDELRESAANLIDEAVKSTPLAGIGNILRDTPPAPPMLQTAPGTLSGKDVTGTVSTPVDLPQTFPETPASLGPQADTAQSDADNTENLLTQELPVADDKELRPFYLSELAQWLASRYRAGKGAGTLEVNCQNLDHYCGITLANQFRGGRKGLLRYAFHASMLQGLYRLYIDRFMEALNLAASKRNFTAEQNRQFHLAIAGKAVLWATALQGILALPDLQGPLNKIEDCAKKVVDTSLQLTNAVFELDELRAGKSSPQQINATQMRIEGIAARLRRAEDEHANAQRILAEAIRKNSGKTLDNENLLFMAAWVERRRMQDPEANTTLKTCGALLRDLARRCAQAGT